MGQRIAIELLVAVLIGALLGLLGPFDTYAFGLGPRMAYWIFLILAGLAIFRPMGIASTWLAAEAGMPGWAARGIAIAVGSLPMTLLVAWLFNGFDLGRALRFDGLPVLYGQVLLVSVLTESVYHAVFRRRIEAQQSVDATVTVPEALPGPGVQAQFPESTFADRLPAGFGPLQALGGEDHYVRAYGEHGTALVLIRLRDAIAEIGTSQPGEQVHRSWWVARAAVTGQRSEGRVVRLVLSGGHEVPVARERVAQLRAAGWF